MLGDRMNETSRNKRSSKYPPMRRSVETEIKATIGEFSQLLEKNRKVQ